MQLWGELRAGQRILMADCWETSAWGCWGRRNQLTWPVFTLHRKFKQHLSLPMSVPKQRPFLIHGLCVARNVKTLTFFFAWSFCKNSSKNKSIANCNFNSHKLYLVYEVLVTDHSNYCRREQNQRTTGSQVSPGGGDSTVADLKYFFKGHYLNVWVRRRVRGSSNARNQSAHGISLEELHAEVAGRRGLQHRELPFCRGVIQHLDAQFQSTN